MERRSQLPRWYHGRRLVATAARKPIRCRPRLLASGGVHYAHQPDELLLPPGGGIAVHCGGGGHVNRRPTAVHPRALAKRDDPLAQSARTGHTPLRFREHISGGQSAHVSLERAYQYPPVLAARAEQAADGQHGPELCGTSGRRVRAPAGDVPLALSRRDLLAPPGLLRAIPDLSRRHAARDRWVESRVSMVRTKTDSQVREATYLEVAAAHRPGSPAARDVPRRAVCPHSPRAVHRVSVVPALFRYGDVVHLPAAAGAGARQRADHFPLCPDVRRLLRRAPAHSKRPILRDVFRRPRAGSDRATPG